MKLPAGIFYGQLKLIENEEQFQYIAEDLHDCKVLGFDTETRPSFKKGRVNNVSLIQLAVSDKAWLIRLNHLGFSNALVGLLEDPEVLKIGVGLRDDIMRLKFMHSFNPAGFLELSEYVKAFGIEDNGLRKLAANILGIKVSKTQQLANWEQTDLTPAQLSYAATDAWVCYEMYQKLRNVKREQF